MRAHRITKKDCCFMIDFIIGALKKSGLANEVDFIVYGSYFEIWRDGLSDLDGIFYFSKHSPLHPDLRPKIKEFQSQITLLYKELPFLKAGQYLYDIFVFDSFHGNDGRFLMFDADWINAFWQRTSWRLVHGQMFMDKLKPVMWRNQNEFELALGLHKLRNYLLFEIPRSPSDMLMSYAISVSKFFKVLPRVATLITNKPMAKSLSELEQIFEDIDYSPFRELWEKTSNCDTQKTYFRRWHEPGDTTFIRCLECFEATLISLVLHYQRRSK